ncbi:MAG TPA: enoyl-ACP reductase FabI [Acidimicrobiia bacterium]|nr:enoyl-ACP reductase FabI [Acidimicrobiia bacterium]
MGLLEGKRLLITGVLTDASLGFGVAQLAQREGAEIVITSVGKAHKHTERAARKLPTEPDIIEFDVADAAHPAIVREQLAAKWDRVDGALHAIGFAPPVCLGGTFLDAEWDDVGVALNVSAYSLKAVADAVVPLMHDGGSIVGLDFDAAVAWPAYDWMGVAKAALESTARYLARYLGSQGIRVNLVAAGPIKTIAARSIPGFSKFEDVWADRAPLGWNVKDSDAVARACVALLSDWFPMTTGEIVHVDGGYHAVGA